MFRVDWVALIAAGVWAGPTTVCAQQPLTLRGTVVDESGSPVSGAEVLAHDGGARAGSGPNGSWTLVVTATTQQLSARKLGFVPATVNLTPESFHKSITITLRRTPLLLDSVIVDARRERLLSTFRRAEKGIGTVVFAEQIAAYSGSFFNMTDLLRWLPRFNLHAVPRCNGAPAVWVDGRPIPRSANLNLYIGPYDIEAVELVRGAQAVFEERWSRAPEQKRGGGAAPDTAPARWELPLEAGRCEKLLLVWSTQYVREGVRW